MPTTLSPNVIKTALMLIASNLFMTYAWYGVLHDFRNRPWLVAVLAGWLVAFFEYMMQVPANRIGVQVFSVPQLKIMQEVISLGVFIPFSLLYLREKWSWNFVWAGLCLLGAVYFMFFRKAA